MFQITFNLDIFRDEADTQRSRKAMLACMQSLVIVNMGYLQRYGKTPTLYRSHVVYRAEPKGQEFWQDIPTTFARGYGDCEDLACWRCAELNAAGVRAIPYIRWKGPRYHALVRLPDGRVEDPSLALGMAGHPVTREPVYI